MRWRSLTPTHRRPNLRRPRAKAASTTSAAPVRQAREECAFPRLYFLAMIRLMSLISRFLIKLGYRDIVIESSYSWQKSSGVRPEYEEAVVIARAADGTLHRICCRCSWPPSQGAITSATPITEAELLAAISKSSFADGSGARTHYEAKSGLQPTNQPQGQREGSDH
jgi:hypothetical protein